jgi:hypothetical protein
MRNSPAGHQASEISRRKAPHRQRKPRPCPAGCGQAAVRLAVDRIGGDEDRAPAQGGVLPAQDVLQGAADDRQAHAGPADHLAEIQRADPAGRGVVDLEHHRESVLGRRPGDIDSPREHQMRRKPRGFAGFRPGQPAPPQKRKQLHPVHGKGGPHSVPAEDPRGELRFLRVLLIVRGRQDQMHFVPLPGEGLAHLHHLQAVGRGGRDGGGAQVGDPHAAPVSER